MFQAKKTGYKGPADTQSVYVLATEALCVAGSQSRRTEFEGSGEPGTVLRGEVVD